MEHPIDSRRILTEGPLVRATGQARPGDRGPPGPVQRKKELSQVIHVGKEVAELTRRECVEHSEVGS